MPKTVHVSEADPPPLMEKNLVGLFFLVKKDSPPVDRRESKFQYQGRIVGKINDEFYIAQYHEWIVGSAHSMKIISVREMGKWEFWYYAEDWRNRCAGVL